MRPDRFAPEPRHPIYCRHSTQHCVECLLNGSASRIELLQGTLDLPILRTLLAGCLRGHPIAKHIQPTSEELLQVGAAPARSEKVDLGGVGVVGQRQTARAGGSILKTAEV